MKKGETGTRVKYNWDKLKHEFYLSDFAEVAPFLNAKRQEQGNYKDLNPTAGGTLKQIHGWAEEKREWQRSIYQKQLEEAQRELELPIIDLMKWKKQAIQNLVAQLRSGTYVKVKRRDPVTKKLIEVEEWQPGLEPNQVKIVLEAVKTELGEPTKITHQTIAAGGLIGQIEPESVELLDQRTKNALDKK